MVKRWGGVGSPGEAGNLAETMALRHLQHAGLRLVQRNYRVARGPGARAGEIDLIMREPDGTIVFVEVRARAAPGSVLGVAGAAGAARAVGAVGAVGTVGAFGGAAASVGRVKQRRIVYAAQHWLMRQATLPPCRFDVVALDGDHLQWLKAAFDAG
jgi:putative endonuclease